MDRLQAGDRVEIIAPASRCSDTSLNDLKTLLSSWQLDCKISEDIFGPDLLCANTDAKRLHTLKNAFLDPESKLIISARGGYGTARLIQAFSAVTPPPAKKVFIGMSDATVLNIFLQQHWQWPVIHGALAPDRFSPESIAAIKAILFGDIEQVRFQGSPLNARAEESRTIESVVTGGNLSILQTSIGTAWQVQATNKILFIEEVGERAYRIDRILQHLQQAHIFQAADAIVFGDFLRGEEPNGSSLIKPVLERFARDCPIPVVKIEGIGHGHINFPIPLGTKARLTLGQHIDLTCATPIIV